MLGHKRMFNDNKKESNNSNLDVTEIFRIFVETNDI